MDEVKRPILQGEYKLIRVIERTPDSTLYYACSVAAQECRFAIREFALDATLPPEKRAGFMAYFQPIAQRYMDLGHPGVISLRDFFLEDEYIYFVCDFIPGYRLQEIVNFRKNCPFTEVQALGMAVQIAKALQFLHTLREGSLFFADMNLSNVIVSAQGRIMLTDFGLGKLTTTYNPEAPRMGTLGYAAPEQIGPKGIINASTEIYSLGVLMHQLVTGLDPTDDPNVILPVQECNPAISFDYAHIVAVATDADPRKRFSSITEMLLALQAIAPQRALARKQSNRSLAGELLGVLTAPFRKAQ